MEYAQKRTTDMDRANDYQAVMAAVSRATGIPETFIFSKRKGQIYYDARWIAVQLFADLGYYSGQIADMAGMTVRNVNLVLSQLKQREPSTWRQFRSELEACRKALGITRTA